MKHALLVVCRDFVLWAIWKLMSQMRHFPAEHIDRREPSLPFLGHATCRACGDGWHVFIPDESDVNENMTLPCPKCEQHAGRFD